MGEVRSFVRRSNRLTPARTRAWESNQKRYLVPVPAGVTDTAIADDHGIAVTDIFRSTGPRVVEIGSGRGDSLVAMAQAAPQTNFLAVEVYRPAVAVLLGQLARTELNNVRVIVADAVQVLSKLIPAGSLDGLWLFFPDPWPKSRHHKRRIVSPAFANLVAQKLRPGGEWRLATDWEHYAQHIRSVLDDHDQFTNPHGGWAPRWDARPITKFERRGLDAGREIFDLTYRRRDGT